MTTGLRFAMVTTFYPPYSFGGDGVAVRHLSHALARRGHSVEVIHDIDAYHLQEPRVPPSLIEPPGVRVHGLRSRFGRLSCLATQQCGRPIVHGRRIRQLLQDRFDVVHFHNVSLVGGPGIIRHAGGIRLLTAHEHWLVCPTHVLWRHGRERCDARECLRCQIHYRRPPQLWRGTRWERRQWDKVDAFLAFSDFSARRHSEFGFRPPMTVVPPFLPERLPEHRTPPAGQQFLGSQSAPYFLFVGRLELIKGVQDVIPLFTGDGDEELWIVGDGSQATALRQLARSAPRVRFLGLVPNDRLVSLYRGAIATVVPSVCDEVFSLVILESFREGTPIVARGIGPFPETVQRSGGGLLFSTTDELARALSLLAGDRPLRDALGTRARLAFNDTWAEGVAIESYFDVIRDVARRRGLTHVLDRLCAGGHENA